MTWVSIALSMEWHLEEKVVDEHLGYYGSLTVPEKGNVTRDRSPCFNYYVEHDFRREQQRKVCFNQGKMKELRKILSPRKIFANLLSGTQREFMIENRLSSEEMAELLRIKKATYWFEKNVPDLSKDVGGWRGNNAGLTRMRCGEEALTLIAFFKKLKTLKLTRKFQPLAICANSYQNGLNHAGAIMASDTGKMIVFDSWHDDGPAPARVISRKEFVRKRYSDFGTSGVHQSRRPALP